MSEFRRAWLAATSTEGSSPEELVFGDFDVLVATSSWDARCLCLLGCEVSVGHGVGVFFENRGAGTLRDRHDPLVRAFLEDVSEEHSVIERGSEDLDELWSELWDAIVAEWRRREGRPLRVLLDLSTCPRYYAMALLAAGFRNSVIGELCIFYAEGKYPDASPDSPHEAFTAGRWETIPVPQLEGISDPGVPRHYVVSLGFEGSKTVRAISGEGADNVTVLFPRPGVRAEYEERTRDANRILFEDFGVGPDEVVEAAAGDAVAVWRVLSESAARWRGNDTYYLPAGTKPHSIGMALDALIGGTTSVMYAKPAAHKESATEALGKYWLYTVRDVTVVPGL